MDKAKIRLSKEEQELVNNAGWILTKNGIIQKAKLLLEQVRNDQQAFIESHAGLLPEEVVQIPPKISRGENYRGLPWLMLDYPRHFERHNHFAIRSMFWWGNFFSSTLHLSGTYKKRYEVRLQEYVSRPGNDWFICINENEWEHHLEADNYLPLESMDPSRIREYFYQKEFIKLTKTYPLTRWDHAGEWLMTTFLETVNVVQD
jgi:hypothetical protein